MELYIKYRYKILFIFIFIIMNLYLFINTPFDKIDSREYLKLLIPISAIIFSLFLTKLKLIKIFKLLFYLLLIHIIFSFIYELATHGMLFNKSNDGRYYLQMLGRSAGETALAFYVLYVGTLFYFYLNSSLTKNKNILILLFFVVINISIISQSRTWLVNFFYLILLV